jgi:magnesium-protoporphyrin IX monomethyl ester (oxidative) cyclase
MLKVELIFPAFEIYFTHEAPIGLAYLKAVCQNAGHEVEIFDNNVMNLPLKEALQKIKGADVAAMSMTTPTYKTVKKMCDAIRTKLGIPVILGGPHPTIDPKDCLNFCDFVVLGEGEETFVELLKALENGRKLSDLKKIKGIGFKWNKEKIVNVQRPLNHDLDKLPFPDWNGFPISKYGSAIRTSGRSLPIVTSRGCPFNCCYCFKGLFGRAFRARSPKSVADELVYLKENFGIKEFQIADDAFAANKKRAIEICQEIVKRDLNLPWSLPNGIRASSLNEEVVEWMKKAGLKYTGLGIESGSQKILDNIGKQQKLDDVRTAVKLLKKYKITTVGFFMFGLPGDTIETMKETVKFAKSLDLDYCSISMTTPYPGTRLYDEVEEKGGKFLVKDQEDLFSLGSKCKFMMPNMATPEEIEKAYKKARIELLLQPKIILRALKSPKKLWAGAKVAYKWILKT